MLLLILVEILYRLHKHKYMKITFLFLAFFAFECIVRESIQLLPCKLFGGGGDDYDDESLCIN